MEYSLSTKKHAKLTENEALSPTLLTRLADTLDRLVVVSECEHDRSHLLIMVMMVML